MHCILTSHPWRCRQDLCSQTVHQKLHVTYADNPRRTSVDLLGVIEFPNLALATQAVDFGCCLMDTMQRTTVQLTNPGKVAVDYCWAWTKQDGGRHFCLPSMSLVMTNTGVRFFYSPSRYAGIRNNKLQSIASRTNVWLERQLVTFL
jgi:hypothetical protein